MSKRPWERLAAGARWSGLPHAGGYIECWQVIGYSEEGPEDVADGLDEESARALADAYNAQPALAEALRTIADGPCIRRPDPAKSGDCGECWSCIARAALRAAGLDD